MAGNSFGTLFKLTTFGESHGVGIGGIIDGCPSGLLISVDFINKELARRKPGQSAITTSRSEDDHIEILSGIFEGKSIGTPISFLIRNKDQKSEDYTKLKDAFRPSHADFTYQEKYGHRDYRGGGRSSARETAARVAAGAIAKLFIQQSGINVKSYVSAVGNISLDKSYHEINLDEIENNIVRCPDVEIANQMINLITLCKENGDTVGGIISTIIKGVPVGLGEPVFDKLHARLGYAMLGINAVKGFEVGSGFKSSTLNGSVNNDEFILENKEVKTKTNNSGGIQGGISNGMDITFSVAFKPVATILQTQQTLDKNYNSIEIKAEGRHDPCVLPRAVPIVEAMAALVIADFLLLRRVDNLQ